MILIIITLTSAQALTITLTNTEKTTLGITGGTAATSDKCVGKTAGQAPIGGICANVQGQSSSSNVCDGSGHCVTKCEQQKGTGWSCLIVKSGCSNGAAILESTNQPVICASSLCPGATNNVCVQAGTTGTGQQGPCTNDALKCESNKLELCAENKWIDASLTCENGCKEDLTTCRVTTTSCCKPSTAVAPGCTAEYPIKETQAGKEVCCIFSLSCSENTITYYKKCKEGTDIPFSVGGTVGSIDCPAKCNTQITTAKTIDEAKTKGCAAATTAGCATASDLTNLKYDGTAAYVCGKEGETFKWKYVNTCDGTYSILNDITKQKGTCKEGSSRAECCKTKECRITSVDLLPKYQDEWTIELLGDPNILVKGRATITFKWIPKNSNAGSPITDSVTVTEADACPGVAQT